MDSIDKKLNEWVVNFRDSSLPNWDNLPDLDLYMDQVITYLERELKHFNIDESDKAITTWMINNYVKGGLLPSSYKKKYSKEHLAYLLAISSIKQILSIPNIASLFSAASQTETDPKNLYTYFLNTQKDAINKLTNQTLEFLEKNTNQSQQNKLYLYDIVFKLAIEAQVKKIVADKILFLLETNEEFYKEEIQRLTKEQLELQKIQREQKKKIN